MGCFHFILTHEDPFGLGWRHQPGPKTPLILVGTTNRDQRGALWSGLVVPPGTKELGLYWSRLVAPTGIKDLFRPLTVGTGTKDPFSLGSNTSRDKCEGTKVISVVVLVRLNINLVRIILITMHVSKSI